MDTKETDLHLLLDNQLCFAVYAASREITKLYRPFLKELGLTYTQYITMLVLWEVEELSVKQLGEKLFLDSGTLTPLLKKLEAAGLVTRRRSAEDERVLLVHITDLGHRLKDKARSIPMKLACGIGLSQHELIFLRESLKNLTEDIHNRKDEDLIACGLDDEATE